MKKKAQKFSFIMMIVFALTGIAMTIVSAVTVGSTGSYGYGSSSPLAGLVFPIILGGLVGTFSVTAIWACVLEHFSNVEKDIDKIYRKQCGKEELPDSAYSYLPKFIEDMKNPKPQTQYQPYPQQYGQPPYQQPMQQPFQQPAQPAQPPVQPVQPPVQQPPVQQPPVQQPAQPTQQAQPIQLEKQAQSQPTATPAPTVNQPVSQPVAPQTPQNWTCPNCGTTNAADANFCLTCGHKRT